MKIDLWFEGYVGIDGRIAVSKLPEKFSHEAWEALDLYLHDEPSPDLGLGADEAGLYRFELEVESGFEGCEDHEFAFSIGNFEVME